MCICGCSAYQTTALLLEMSIFCVGARYEIQLASYGSKHASQPLFDNQFLPTYTHNLKSNNCSLYYWRHSLCGLELHERSNWEAMASDMHWSFSDITVSLYIYSLFGAQLQMITKITYLMTAYYAPNNGPTANDASFCKE